LKTNTWNKDSYELHDYESEEKTKNNFEISSGGYLTRKGENIKFVPTAEMNDDYRSKAITSLECNEDTFFIKRIIDENTPLSEQVNSGNSPWLVTKLIKSHDGKEV
jgi:hypothetical protein